MNKKTKKDQILDEALKLLPWYVSGRLTIGEKNYVDEMLEKHPELQEQLEEEHYLHNFINDEHPLFQLSAIEPSKERLKAVFNNEAFDISNDFVDSSQSLQDKPSKIFNFIQSLISGGNITKAQYMGFASIAALSVALLFAFVKPLVNTKNTFHPAYEGTSQSDKASILIGLSIAPDDDRLAKMLEGFQTKISVAGGKKGMYRISFTKKPSPEALKILVKKLSENEELVWFAGESY